MTNPPSGNIGIDPSKDTSLPLQAINEWLDLPAQGEQINELAAITLHLSHLRTCKCSHQDRSVSLERICERAFNNVDKLIPTLANLAPPPTGKLRQIIRSTQSVLRALAEDIASLSAAAHETAEAESALSAHCMRSLSLHLLISDLTAAPAGTGIWQLLHHIFGKTRAQVIDTQQPDPPPTSQDTYFAATLLACAQPAAFTSRETWFLAQYLAQHTDLLRLIDNSEAVSSTSFWIDPARDAPATPCARKDAPTTGDVTYFNCDRLAALVRKQLAALRSGIQPGRIGLDEFAGTPAGRGALRRLAEALGNPGKRRFPRRRQHYRAVLCAGLQNLWNLFRQRGEDDVETSSWMITNESPDGYSIMHVLGSASSVSVGDIVALRAEADSRWQVCIARWAHSENQEHLEFGLQILATDATPAMLVTPANSAPGQVRTRRQPVLILPQVPPLRLDEMLIAPSGLLAEQTRQHILIIEQGNIEVREVRNTRLNEQNGLIEVFSIEPDGH